MEAFEPIPPPLPEDDENVRWALSTAGALWMRGDHVEALRWLRCAAEHAAEIDADARAIHLFNVAADVQASFDVGVGPSEAEQEDEAETTQVQCSPLLLRGSSFDDAEPDTGIMEPFASKPEPDASGARAKRASLPAPTPTLRDAVESWSAGPPAASGEGRSVEPAQSSMIPSMRVAVVGGGPGEVRLVLLSPGDAPPEGAGVAILVPLSTLDATVIGKLFGPNLD